MTSKIILLLSFWFLLFSAKSLNAQSFGFGCLGLSGVYGGYSYQTYQADGLNDYLNSQYPNNDNFNFSSATGFRIGANIFRAKFAEYFLTAKGYYQFLDQSEEVEFTTDNSIQKNKYNLSMDYWAFGFDLGLPIARFVDWKILEGLVTLNSIQIKKEVFIEGQKEDEIIYKKDGLNTGYYFGTGLVVQIIPAYLSIEGSAGYNFINIENLDNKDFNSSQQNSDLINQGGFGVSLQANLSIPL